MNVLYNIIALLIVVLAAGVALRHLLPARLTQWPGNKSANCPPTAKTGCDGCNGGCR